MQSRDPGKPCSRANRQPAPASFGIRWPELAPAFPITPPPASRRLYLAGHRVPALRADHARHSHAMAISSPMPAPHPHYFVDFDAAVRKRTSSFTVLPPAKAARKSNLQRTASFLSLPALETASLLPPPPPRRTSKESRAMAAVPRTYPLDPTSFPKTQPPSSTRVACSILRKPVPSYPPPPTPLPTLVFPTVPPMSRMPSPPRSTVPNFPPSPVPLVKCTPTVFNPCSKSFSKPRNPKSARRFLPPRERYPKCKDEPSLYRTALLARMGSSPQGEQILRMGVRLAVAMIEATQALEGIVAEADTLDMDLDADGELDEDEPVTPTEDKPVFLEPVVASPHFTDSWLMIPLEDWEMIEQ